MLNKKTNKKVFAILATVLTVSVTGAVAFQEPTQGPSSDGFQGFLQHLISGDKDLDTASPATPASGKVGLDVTTGDVNSVEVVQNPDGDLLERVEFIQENMLEGWGAISVDGGNVGIGTETPSGKLQINSQDGFIFDSSSVNTTMRFGSALTGEATAELGFDRATGKISIKEGITGSTLNDFVTILSDGNVGIGTSSPERKLHIYDPSTSEDLILGESGSTAKQLTIGYSEEYNVARIQAVHQNVGFNPLLLNPDGGNVGIGITNPTTKLSISDLVQIQGNASPQWATSGAGIEIGYDSDNAGGQVIGRAVIQSYDRDADVSKSLRIGANDIEFLTGSTGGGTEKMRITNGGNVGIGTASPTAPLTIQGTAINNALDVLNEDWSLAASLYNIGSGGNNGGGLSLQDSSGTNSVRLRSDGGVNYIKDGNVGIGTATPAWPLTIENNYLSQLGIESVEVDGSAGIALKNDSRVWNIANRGDTNDSFTIRDVTADEHRLVIDSFGNVGIGTVIPMSTLEVAGTTTNYANFMVHDGAEADRRGVEIRGIDDTHDYGEVFAYKYGTGWGGRNLVLNGHGGNVGIGVTSPSEKLEVNGNVKGVAFLYTSDESLKEEITPVTDALSKIQALEGVNFKWKENGESAVGLIAQNVETVFPELVATDENTGLKAVQYANLVAPLIEAIKDQQAQIEELQVRIAELENK